MKTRFSTFRVCIAAAVAVALLSVSRPGYAVTVARYAWEFPRVTAITTAADALKARLSEQIQAILDAGHLAPLYVSYADQAATGYRVYHEPGRVITTLAWAYPHLSPIQQAAVRTRVQATLAHPVHAPWAPFPQPSNAGTPREFHPKSRWWYDSPHWGSARPRVQVLYGLWLYAYRSGDWASIQSYWGNITSMYNDLSGEADLYGTMCAHIGMARMADFFGATSIRTQALNNLQTMLNTGLNLTTVENRAWDKTPYWISPYRDMYDPDNWGTIYRGWIFLNLSPEIGRYLHDHVLTATLTRHQEGLALWPKWWLCRADYFGRSWTGGEGIGLTPEAMGMIFPVERWVVGTDAPTLAGYMRSSPTGIGDCYWIESLVSAIEAFGVTTWTDVRPAAGVESWHIY